MMDKFKLQVFCCCCNLRTGSLVIGTLGWLMTLIQLFYLTSPLKTEKRKYKDSEEDIAIEIGYGFVTLLVCIALIWGVYKNNRRFILPWLVLKCLECIIWTIITVIIFILFFFMEGKLLMIFQFFIIFFVTTLCWYFWLCVWSLYNEMTEDFATDIPMNQTVPMKDTMSQKEKQQYSIESV